MSKPTKADAELLLRLFAIMRSDDDFKRAMWWLYEKLDVKSYRAFKKKYPMGEVRDTETSWLSLTIGRF